MSSNQELIDELMNRLADRYTAEELCDILQLDVWDIIEAFRDLIVDRGIDV